MNSRAFRPKDLDAALMYAPPWAREAEPEPDPEPESAAEADDMAELPPEEEAPEDADEMPRFLGDRAMLDLRRRLSLDPEVVPPPPIVLEERPSAVRIAVRLCAVTAVAALVAWVVVSYSRLRLRAHEMARTDVTEVASATPGAVKLVHVHTAMPDPAAAPPDEAAAGPTPVHAFAAEEKAPAPPSADMAPEQQAGVSVAVKTPGPASAWPPPPPQQQPSESAAVQTAAPTGGWPAPPQQESIAVQTPPPPPAPAATDTRPTLDAEEIAVLLNRGKAFLNDGDVVSARLVLRRAAEAGSAEAALALGASYDPLVIKQTGAVGVQSDAEQARQWYQRAAALGSNAASRQLANLANVRR